MFMIHVADGEHKTAHYALCTGFMALGMMLPGMASGWLQQQMGYTTFFVWVCVATLPSVAVAAMLKIPPEFGRKQEEADASAAAPSQAAAGTAPVSPTPASSAKP
jgi:PAT family beta-lactamase induction signal transducer AmpG